MSTELTQGDAQWGKIQEAVVTGDLSVLTAQERVRYMLEYCKAAGLNPITQPLAYMTLNGKVVLYAKKDAGDQLRRRDEISTLITSREKIGDVYVVTARAKTKSGREEESTGAVSIMNLRGDALANAYMKAETKAKRRVTLSISGLGIPDEEEIKGIVGAREIPSDVSDAPKPTPAPQALPAQIPVVDESILTYKVSLGNRFHGRVMGDLDPAEVARYIADAEKHYLNKSMSKETAEFLIKAQQYVAYCDSKKVAEIA